VSHQVFSTVLGTQLAQPRPLQVLCYDIGCFGLLIVRFPGAFDVSGKNTPLSASEIRFQGQLKIMDCLLSFGGPGGLQLLPGSDIQQTSLATLTSFSTQANVILLDVSRIQPTVLRVMTIGSSGSTFPAKGVRASAPYSVQALAMTGPRAGAAFEDDPYGVHSWSDGVIYGGGATPGCLGLAECETTSDARLGNASFAFRVRRAHPNTGAIYLLGIGSTTTAESLSRLQLWFDPSLPISAVLGSRRLAAVITAVRNRGLAIC